MENKRYLTEYIRKDLAKKMVFIGGARQVGKTYLSKTLLNHFASDQYYNWDASAHRKTVLRKNWDREKKLVVFDELHKYRRWKSWLKGVYDTESAPPAILVTGSARLNVFRRGDDSMMGRYYYYRLHPFSVKEAVENLGYGRNEAFSRLWERGGFPEPLMSDDKINAARWQKERLEKIIREDILLLENVRHLGALELLVDLLRERVGTPLSYQNLSEDLSVSPQTVKTWVQLLERMYLIFLVPPYHVSVARAIKKQAKAYFFDYSEIDDPGPRFENMIAAHLLKEIHFLEDTTGSRVSLHTLRDKEKREVDFLIALKNKPVELIEAKLSGDDFSKHLLYYSERFPDAQAIQVVRDLPKSRSRANARMLGGAEFLLSRKA